jgi:hypothetical protein
MKGKRGAIKLMGQEGVKWELGGGEMTSRGGKTWVRRREEGDKKEGGAGGDKVLKCLLSVHEKEKVYENSFKKTRLRICDGKTNRNFNLKQCCGSGTGFRCIFTPRIRDPDPGRFFSGSRILTTSQIQYIFKILPLKMAKTGKIKFF